MASVPAVVDSLSDSEAETLSEESTFKDVEATFVRRGHQTCHRSKRNASEALQARFNYDIIYPSSILMLYDVIVLIIVNLLNKS